MRPSNAERHGQRRSQPAGAHKAPAAAALSARPGCSRAGGRGGAHKALRSANPAATTARGPRGRQKAGRPPGGGLAVAAPRHHEPSCCALGRVGRRAVQSALSQGEHPLACGPAHRMRAARSSARRLWECRRKLWCQGARSAKSALTFTTRAFSRMNLPGVQGRGVRGAGRKRAWGSEPRAGGRRGSPSTPGVRTPQRTRTCAANTRPPCRSPSLYFWLCSWAIR